MRTAFLYIVFCIVCCQSAFTQDLNQDTTTQNIVKNRWIDQFGIGTDITLGKIINQRHSQRYSAFVRINGIKKRYRIFEFSYNEFDVRLTKNLQSFKGRERGYFMFLVQKHGFNYRFRNPKSIPTNLNFAVFYGLMYESMNYRTILPEENNFDSNRYGILAGVEIESVLKIYKSLDLVIALPLSLFDIAYLDTKYLTDPIENVSEYETRLGKYIRVFKVSLQYTL